MATFLISGLVTTMGLIIPSAATYYSVEITTMATQFTWFTGAVFVGYLLSFVVFDRFTIKSVLIVAYGSCISAALLIHFIKSYTLLALWLVIFGLGISIASCGSSTLITQLWQDKARQTILVSQDAFFNGGGVIFSLIASWFIANSFQFSSTYLLVGFITLLVLGLLLVANFDQRSPETIPMETSPGALTTQWNTEIILVGFSLLLFMLAKISVFVWAPQFIGEHFSVDGSEPGTFMSNIFSAALVGSLIGTWLASRVKVKYLLYSFVTISTTSIWLLLSSRDIATVLMLAFMYGISISATFNAYMAYALTLVKTPTHRNIAYMLVMSALGGALAPYCSSKVVEMRDATDDALLFSFAVLIVVMVTLILSELLSRSNPNSTRT
ncbi:MAG: MFS transporter [Gammaproteobacteria bacterium]|jgi:MFS transporter, TsgA protein|nr:MFS transporter [Gammaproteobacteria bacterium]MBT5202544.1 MFS transporter [Gammaproteobacteria bacterium]MBT5604169.1 MFS transporter [Gammaproteobacteria bacterium]MBT6244518.1 MFS transporter [Gammaproteobacteria bacterium]